MWKSGEQNKELSQKVVGYVFDNPKTFPPKEKKVWDNFLKIYWIEDSDELDKTKIFSDHTRIIDNGSCRECGKHIETYKEKFYAKKTESSILTSILYCCENGYCKSCAIKLGSMYQIDDNPLYIVKHEEINFGSCEHLITRNYYNDGSVVEYDSENAPRIRDK